MNLSRGSLNTDLGKYLYDWSPLKGKATRVEIAQDIIASFCTREHRKWLESEQWRPEQPVFIDGEVGLELYQRWAQSWYYFGYETPMLICTGDDPSDLE